MTALMEAVNAKFGRPAVPLKSLYEIDKDGDIFPLTEIKELQHDRLYYVLNINEELPRLRSMEQFFGRLATEQGLNNENLLVIQTVFLEQGISLPQLLATGPSGITDEKLEKYGILQGGLRISILQVLRR